MPGDIVPGGLGDFITITGTPFNFEQVFGTSYYSMEGYLTIPAPLLRWNGTEWVEENDSPPHPVDLY